MDPASIKTFNDLQFLKMQLQDLKASNEKARRADEFVDVNIHKSREERLRALVNELHTAPISTSAGPDLSLGDLLTEASTGDAFTYTSGKQQKPDYKISAADLARRSTELQETVRGYANSLEKVNELETDVFRTKKSKKTKEVSEHPKTKMKVIWDDSMVTPLKIDTYRTR